MNLQYLRGMFCAFAALVLATVAFGKPPTPQQALDYAKSVVFVTRVVQGDEVHQYVKEVWRFDPGLGTPPTVGSEYGKPIPGASKSRYPNRDAIVFTFGDDRPEGVTAWWGIQVIENGMVMPMNMNVADLRAAVKKRS